MIVIIRQMYKINNCGMVKATFLEEMLLNGTRKETEK